MAMTLALIGSLATMVTLLSGCSSKPDRDEKAPTKEEKGSEPKSRVQHGTNGEVIVKLDAATQKLMGLEISPLKAGQLEPEKKAFGRVLDVTPLVSLAADLTTAQAAAEASQAELKRLTTLTAQNNASQRALQAAQAAAAHDQAQVEATWLRLLGTWGSAIAERKDLTGFVQSLATLAAALVELELPAGESLTGVPTGARLLTLSGDSRPVQAQFVGPAPVVDSQMQGHGFLFLVESNQTRLAPGAAVTGFITLPGAPQTGVVLPRNAVVRFNGATWVYRLGGEESFERVEIALGPPLADGWFLPKGLKPEDKVVTVGAQQVLSEELKAQGGEE